jgi:protein phosphatase 2C-like protein
MYDSLFKEKVRGQLYILLRREKRVGIKKMELVQSKKWHAIGCSVRGARHIENGMPNQDAIKMMIATTTTSLQSNNNAIILAIADGHGNSINFRSAIGARFAVEIACQKLLGIAGQVATFTNIAMFNDIVQNSLPRILSQEWHLTVDNHFKSNPLTSGELTQLNNDAKIKERISKEPKIAYGTTLLCALLSEQFVILAQIGDGDILTVNEVGKVIRPILQDGEARVEKEMINSLYMHESWNGFKIVFLREPQTFPRLIMLTTDGYKNSYHDENAFCRVAIEYMTMIQEKGLQDVSSKLGKITSEISKEGSGDDITIGLIVDAGKIK